MLRSRTRSRPAPTQIAGQPLASCLVPTALGEVGLLWRGGAVCGVLLPGPDGGVRPDPRWEEAAAVDPPAWVRAVARKITAHLAGRRQALEEAPIDLGGLTPFTRAVLTEARRVPPGEVVSYGELAARVGKPGGGRAVGGAMGRNPVPLLVPCHRVLAAGGRPGGFSGPGGLDLKRRLLEVEGVSLPD